MHYALIGDCIFRSIRNNSQGGDEKYVDGHKQEEVRSMRNGRRGKDIG